MFQPALSLNGRRHQIVNFISDQSAAIVFLRESGPELFLMLIDPSDQIIRDAGINRAILAAGHHVDGYAGIAL